MKSFCDIFNEKKKKNNDTIHFIVLWFRCICKKIKKIKRQFLMFVARTPNPSVKVNSTASTVLHRLVLLIVCVYLPNVRALQYKLGPERLTRLESSNVLQLPVVELFTPNDLYKKSTGCFEVEEFEVCLQKFQNVFNAHLCP